MATPLARLFDQVINDPDIRAEFAGSPVSFLRDHGYAELDAADVQEALFVLADGSAPSDAAALIDGGRSIDTLDSPDDGLSGAAAALGAALRTIVGFEVDVDPGDLDGLDDVGDVPADGLDHDVQHVDPDDLDESDDDDSPVDDATAVVDGNAGIASAFDDHASVDAEQSDRLDELDDAMDSELDVLADVFDDVHGSTLRGDDTIVAPDTSPTAPEGEVDDGWNDIVY